MENVDLQKIGKDQPIGVEQFCQGLRYAGENHLKGYFHYTKWSSFVSMQTPVKLPDGRERRVLLLPPPNDKNDLTEGKIDPRYWYFSFAYGPHEKVPMWAIYGKQSPEAIRMRIGFNELMQWYNQPRHDVYGVDADGTYTCLTDQLEWIRLIDIGYVSKDIPNKVEMACVKHRHKEYNVFPFCQVLNRANALHGEYAPYFKDDGWMFEQEVRLLFKFRIPLSCKKLAVDFDEPLRSVVSRPNMNIVSSPWRDVLCADGIRLSDTVASEYRGKIAI